MRLLPKFLQKKKTLSDLDIKLKKYPKRQRKILKKLHAEYENGNVLKTYKKE